MRKKRHFTNNEIEAYIEYVLEGDKRYQELCYLEQAKAESYYRSIQENIDILEGLVRKGYDVLKYKKPKDNPSWSTAVQYVQDNLDKKTYSPIHEVTTDDADSHRWLVESSIRERFKKES